ncbi:MAG TPA: FkbM family methyltransferase [Blastocatellia bacterium]|nr:FkbM family methyltransferase [Blastocatellia bacterium]
MSALIQKFESARGAYRASGVRGVAAAAADSLKISLIAKRLRRWWHKRDHWLVGKAVELQGNRVSIDGCLFDVSSSAISTSLKSRFALDRYEKPEREAIARFLDPALPIVEFGGGIGVVSCIANKRLQNPDRHVVVEANPDLLPLLARNRMLNDCRFSILERALAYDEDRVTFYLADQFVASGVQRAAARSIKVQTTSLKSIVETEGFDRFTLICDVEGGEVQLIEREKELIGALVDTIMLEVHPSVVGTSAIENLFSQLRALGFQELYKSCDTLVFKSAAR